MRPRRSPDHRRGPFRRPSPLGPLGRFVRARLHRRLFLWFGATIALTAALMGAVLRLGERTGNAGWKRDYGRVQAFVGDQFARVWDSPGERDAFARSMQEHFETDLEIKDAAGKTLSIYGASCGSWAIHAPVMRDGVEIGAVALCLDRSHPSGPLRVALPLIVVAGVLWAASGVLSRRLARPLSELARVAREIGEGKLSSRVALDYRQYGEVGVVAEALNDMAARVERQVSDQRELLAAVSHELRTPLARIRLLTEMARESGFGPTERDASDREAGQRARVLATCDHLDREVMEIDALVGDLLASSRLDFAALTLSRLDPIEVALRAVERAGLDPSVLEVEEGVAPVDVGRGSTFAVPVDVGRGSAFAVPVDVGRGSAFAVPVDVGRGSAFAVPFTADATLLARALANLIENARAHAGGVERVRVRPTPGGIAFEVEDRGPGFADGDDARAFEPFYRRERGAGAAARERGSLGLGLALCQRIAEAHGGRAYAENREGGGARVGIEITRRGTSER